MGIFLNKVYSDVKLHDYVCLKLDKKPKVPLKTFGILFIISIILFIMYKLLKYISFNLYIRYERSSD